MKRKERILFSLCHLKNDKTRLATNGLVRRGKGRLELHCKASGAQGVFVSPGHLRVHCAQSFHDGIRGNCVGQVTENNGVTDTASTERGEQRAAFGAQEEELDGLCPPMLGSGLETWRLGPPWS